MVDDSNKISRRSLLAGSLAAGSLAVAGCGPREAITASEVKSWDIETDVLIAGSGAAGISAAIEARRAGAEVLVLEKLTKLGGSSAMSGGVIYCGGGNALQKALGFEDTVEDMYNFIAAAGSIHPHLDKVEKYCEESVAHFDWLVENGVPFKEKYSSAKGIPFDDSSLYFSGTEEAYPYREIAKPVPRGVVAGVPGINGGRRLMEALIPSAQKQGAKTQGGVSCERLVRESDGRVTGLIADINGERKAIRARRGVVLACGGFIHNREMVKLYAPELYDCSVPWGNAGDLGMGIQMGIGVGASALRMHHGFAVLALYQPDSILKGIAVNQTGQRFISEEVYHGVLGNEIAFHQKGQAYFIADADSAYKQPRDSVLTAATASTIEELEQKIGVAKDSLVQTVNYYNKNAAKRQDPLFEKSSKYLAPIIKPPFVAYDLSVKSAFVSVHTFGGLHTRPSGQVVDTFGDNIDGLYAAGRTSSGLPTAPYIASGISVGDCTFFGRQAGANAAKA